MNPSTNLPDNPHPPPLFTPPRSPRGPLLGALLLAALGGGGAYLWLRQPGPPVAERAAPAPSARAEDARPLPSLTGTDSRVRELLRGLSSDAEYLRWLSAEDLARRFASASYAIAEGESPRLPLSFLAPTGGFRVTRRAGRAVMAPEGHARYDGIARAVASVDARGAQRVYQELRPLLEAAHAEVAPPGRSLERTLAQAVHRLTRVPVPTGPVELTPKGALYAYADPRLEALGTPEKHLLRMGPHNMRKVQAKLSELASALGLPSPEQARGP